MRIKCLIVERISSTDVIRGSFVADDARSLVPSFKRHGAIPPDHCSTFALFPSGMVRGPLGCPTKARSIPPRCQSRSPSAIAPLQQSSL